MAMAATTLTLRKTLLILTLSLWVNQSYAVSLLSLEENPDGFKVLLLLQAFVLAIVLVLYRQQWRLNRELHRESRTDHLTQIPNRRHFLELAEKTLDLAERHQHPATFLMLDIDHFKRINDTYGHQAGDEVLRKFALTLQAGLRKSDHIGRLGGEEFGVLLTMTGPGFGEEVAERLRQSVSAINLDDIHKDLRITCSIGASFYSKGMTIDQLSKIADDALYRAKSSGRNRVSLQEPGENTR